MVNKLNLLWKNSISFLIPNRQQGSGPLYIFCLVQIIRRLPCLSGHVFKVAQVSWQLGGKGMESYPWGQIFLDIDPLAMGQHSTHTHNIQANSGSSYKLSCILPKKKFCSELVWLLMNYGKGWGSHLIFFGHTPYQHLVNFMQSQHTF